MKDQIASLQAEVLAAIDGAADAAALENVRIAYLGRNGKIPALLEKMRDIPKEDRPVIGKLINEFKTKVNDAFEGRKNALQDKADDGSVDTSLPGRTTNFGSIHPVQQVIEHSIEIFRRLGFAINEGPEIESEFYNFDALNTPKDHPARAEQDTFYILESALQPLAEGQGRRLLRTQTSPVQIRTMKEWKPPIRIIAPGRCYRRDEIDATHLMSFFQIEGLAIGENITVADLKGTLEYFFRELLGRDLQFRFRPHFFPFTEPSFEVDCARATKPGQPVKWLEICGCGMVDPQVLINVDLDPEKYSGWAFGFGPERVAMLRHNIPDLRLFIENDVRFLKQFSKVA
jgi:phenylalanyl-tRNA synthetase alpha chain